ncbi:MAG: hypothetical protein Q9173_003592, partial [Seirophora scorigena]
LYKKDVSIDSGHTSVPIIPSPRKVFTMEKLNHLLPTTGVPQQLVQNFRGKLQHLVSGMLEHQTQLSHHPERSCNGPGRCRIVLVTAVKADNETYPQPSFIDCECGPQSYAHHQRQLDIVRFDLRHKEERARQLRAVEEGVRWLLLRHREFYKAEIRHDQYWLRQDYARTNAVRELRNARVLRRSSDVAKLALDEIGDLDKTLLEEATAPENHHSHPASKFKLLQVDSDDLFIDDEDYEYSACASSGWDFKGKGPETDQKLLNLGEQEPSSDAVREASPDTVKDETTASTPSIKDLSPASSTPKLTAPIKIQLGRLIALSEVLSRFEDIKQKASTYSRDWDREDSLREETSASLHPKPGGAKCCCTDEHRLYNSLLDAAFDPLGQMDIESLLQVEIRKSELRRVMQENVKAERREEVDSILCAFDAHIENQMLDLQTVLGAEGRLKALVEYLRRYDSRTDLQEPEDLNRVSKAVTVELLEQVGAMLERIGREHEGIEMWIEDMIRV